MGPAAIYGWLSLPNAKRESEKELAGAAFLLSNDLAVTCAHVVRDHLGLKKTPPAAPQSLILLRFEALNSDVEATVVPEGWYPDELGAPPGRMCDVAFLRLRTPIEGLRYPALAPWVPRGGRLALVIGAEPGYQRLTQNVPVKLPEHTNIRGLWQLDASSNFGFVVVRGFSGAPLLDEAGTVIWGMVVEVDARGRPVAFAVGADQLYEARHLLSHEVGDATRPTAPDLVEPGLADEMRKLQEQLSKASIERDAARRELEVLRKRLGAVV